MAEESERPSAEERYRKEMQKKINEMKAEQQRRELAKRYMTPQAYERLMNVRISNHELYAQIINFIIAMVQGKRITSKLTEDQLKSILSKLTAKPEGTITFMHK